MDYGSRFYSSRGKYMQDDGSAHCSLMAVVFGPPVGVWVMSTSMDVL